MWLFVLLLLPVRIPPMYMIPVSFELDAATMQHLLHPQALIANGLIY